MFLKGVFVWALDRLHDRTAIDRSRGNESAYVCIALEERHMEMKMEGSVEREFVWHAMYRSKIEMRAAMRVCCIYRYRYLKERTTAGR